MIGPIYEASFDMTWSCKLYFDHLFILFHIVYEYINLWLLDIVHLIINLTVSSCITIVKSCYYSNTQQHSSWYPSQISPPRPIICFSIYFDLWNPKSSISSPFPNPRVLHPPHKPGVTHAVANHERCARRGNTSGQHPALASSHRPAPPLGTPRRCQNSLCPATPLLTIYF